MRKLKAVFIALTLLSFLGQSIVSVASPCQMLASDDMTAMSHVAMSDAMSEMSMDDCCELECQCVIGACTSLLMSSSFALPDFSLSLSTDFAQGMPGATSSFLYSFYRPPISR